MNLRLLGTEPWSRRLAVATLVANVALVVTGGFVRLTGSGLGCPTWPRCTDRGFTPHGAFNAHASIEFGNRMLTFVLAAVAVATLVSAWQSGRRELRRPALLLALSIPAQAVLGGLTVLTGLNPWLVSAHFMFSMGIVSLGVLYLLRVARPAPWGQRPGGTGDLLRRLTYAAAAAVLAVGAVVTGSGPHAGDATAPRNGLDPERLSQLHADLVFLLVGLTVALLVLRRSRAVTVLLVVELAQAVVGFVQYFTGLPVLVVGLHLLGAGLLAAAATWVLLEGSPVEPGDEWGAVPDAALRSRGSHG